MNGPTSYQSAAFLAPEPVDSADATEWPCTHCGQAQDDHLNLNEDLYCLHQDGHIVAGEVFEPDPNYDPATALAETEAEAAWERATGH